MSLALPVAPLPLTEPTSSRTSTIARLFLRARSQHVVPSRFAFRGSAPQDIKACAAAKWPLAHAIMRGVMSALPRTASTSASCLTRSEIKPARIPSAHLPFAKMCKGAQPYLFGSRANDAGASGVGQQLVEDHLHAIPEIARRIVWLLAAMRIAWLLAATLDNN